MTDYSDQNRRTLIHEATTGFRDHDPEGRVRCAGCGIRGRWTGDGIVVNAEGRDVMPYCAAPATSRRRPLAETTGPRHKGHGPWLPDTDPNP